MPKQWQNSKNCFSESKYGNIALIPYKSIVGTKAYVNILVMVGNFDSCSYRNELINLI